MVFFRFAQESCLQFISLIIQNLLRLIHNVIVVKIILHYMIASYHLTATNSNIYIFNVLYLMYMMAFPSNCPGKPTLRRSTHRKIAM